MSIENEGASAEQASATLNQGLKSCRAVLEDYRSKLSGGDAALLAVAANHNSPDAGNDVGEAAGAQSVDGADEGQVFG